MGCGMWIESGGEMDVCIHVRGCGVCVYVWVDVWEKGWGSYECVGVHVHGCVGGVKWGGGQVHSSYVYVWVGV